MNKEGLLIGSILALAVFAGCGVAQEDFDATLAERNLALAERDTANTQAATLQADITKVTAELNQTQSQVRGLQNELNTANVELDTTKEGLSQAEARARRLQSGFDSAIGELDKTKEGLNQAEAQASRLQSEFDSAKGELDKSQEDLNQAQARVESQRIDLDATKAELAKTQTDLNRAQSQVKTFQRQPWKASITAWSEKLSELFDLQTLLLTERVLRTKADLGQITSKEADLERLEAFKAIDLLVGSVGDPQLSRLWDETWPSDDRALSEQEGRPVRDRSGWVKFVGEVPVVIQLTREELALILAQN